MDSYIDQYEVIGYGDFAVQQMGALAIGVDKAFDGALAHVRTLLTNATNDMRTALGARSEVATVTYASAAGDTDPVTVARDTLKRFVAYAKSRPSGDAIAKSVLNNGTLHTALKQRPAKLAATIQLAVEAVEKKKKSMPEHKAWLAELTSAKTALDELNSKVRKSRSERRAMTPEVQAKRAAWLVVYGAAKLQVEVVLRLHGKLDLLPEIFDDLAEVHRVAGANDGPPPAQGTGEPAAPSPPPATPPAATTNGA